MKFLIAGLGNPGPKYENTRHNIGYHVLNHLAELKKADFSDQRYGAVAETTHKGRKLILLQPSTFMNLSGNAVRYWMQQEKIPAERLLVVTDDVNLPAGVIRIKAGGSAGGHNGMQHIIDTLETKTFPRLRIGIGSEYSKGRQVEYVLGEWTQAEKETLNAVTERSAEAILSFVASGIDNTMNVYNTKM